MRHWVLACGLPLLLAIHAATPAAAADCNENGTEDEDETANDPSRDCNGNGVPDECDLLPLGSAFKLIGTSPVATRPREVAAIDFEGDGDPDLVTASIGRGEIGLQRNGGGGALSKTSTVATQGLPGNLVVADFDADGVADVAATTENPSGVVLLGGVSPARLVPRTSLSTGVDYPFAMVALDVDIDGDLDLAVVSWRDAGEGRLAVLLHESPGRFHVNPSLALGQEMPISMAAADWDRDGRTDLASAGQKNADLLALLSRGDGSFWAAAEPMSLRGQALSHLVVADFNADGGPDLAGSTGGPRSGAVLLYSSLDSPVFFKAPLSIGTFSFTTWVDAADLDGDRNIDLTLTSPTGASCVGIRGSVNTVRNTGAGRFAAATDTMLQDDSWSVAVADFDADGNADLATLSEEGHRLSVYGQRTAPLSHDCNQNGRPDECEIPTGDCDRNGTLDVCELASGAVSDCNGNQVPDSCEPDCNANGTADACDVAKGASGDCNGNFIPDECELTAGDINGNGTPDDCDVRLGRSEDCNANGLPDDAESRPLLQLGAMEVLLPGVASSIAVADMNLDGGADIVTTTSGECCPMAAGHISVQVVARPGVIVEAARIPLRTSRAEIAAADFDGDGDPDLAAATPLLSGCLAMEQFETSVSFFANAGNGQLVATSTLALDVDPHVLRPVDLTGDGYQDLVVSSHSPSENTLLLYENDGAGSFSRRELEQWVGEIWTGDVDEDGDVDIIAGAPDGKGGVWVLRNEGDGTIARRGSTLDPEFFEGALALDDLDDDHDLDVAIAGTFLSDLRPSIGLRILFNDGRGSFSRGFALPAVESSFSGLLTLDVTGDGTRDLVSCGRRASAGEHCSVFRRQPGGIFETPRSFLALPPGPLVQEADFGADGSTEVLSWRRSRRVHLWYRSGNGVFVGPQHVPMGAASRDLAITDLDGDGILDFAVASSSQVKLLLRGADGQPRAASSVAVAGEPTRIAGRDLDGDGDADLVTANEAAAEVAASNLSILLNEGAARFGPGRNHAAGARPWDTLIEDFDGDGNPDIAVSDASEPTARLYRGRGDGRFDSAGQLNLSHISPTLRASDLDGDADTDLVSATTPSENPVTEQGIRILLNASRMSFAQPLVIARPSGIAALALGDVDADGDMDFIVADTQALQPYLNSGGKTFEPGTSSPFHWWGGELVLVDLDRDGALDVAANDAGGTITVAVSSGMARFGAPRSFHMSGNFKRLTAADLDGDGDQDLAGALFATGAAGAVIVIENLSAPRGSADADGDGVLDACEDFRRGDPNIDARLDLTDAVTVLAHLFLGAAAPPCADAADADDDGRLQLTDAVAILRFLFQGGAPLPPPGGSCGPDPTPDSLECAGAESCRA